jgi:hypothetical protein
MSEAQVTTYSDGRKDALRVKAYVRWPGDLEGRHTLSYCPPLSPAAFPAGVAELDGWGTEKPTGGGR